MDQGCGRKLRARRQKNRETELKGDARKGKETYILRLPPGVRVTFTKRRLYWILFSGQCQLLLFELPIWFGGSWKINLKYAGRPSRQRDTRLHCSTRWPEVKMPVSPILLPVLDSLTGPYPCTISSLDVLYPHPAAP
jgi:hypothetical protein